MKKKLHIIMFIIFIFSLFSPSQGHIDVSITTGVAGGALLLGVIIGACCTLCLTCCIYKISDSFGSNFDVQLRTKGDMRMGTLSDEVIVRPNTLLSSSSREKETTLINTPTANERRGGEVRGTEPVNVPTREMTLPLFHTVHDRFPPPPSENPPPLVPSETPPRQHFPNTLPRTSNSSITSKLTEIGTRGTPSVSVKEEYDIPYIPAIEEYDIPYIPPTSRNTSRPNNNKKGITKSLSVDELKRLQILPQVGGADPEEQYDAPVGRGNDAISEHYYIVEKRPDFLHSRQPLPPFMEKKFERFAPPTKTTPNMLHKSQTALPMVTTATKTPPPVATKPKMVPEKPAYENVGHLSGKRKK